MERSERGFPFAKTVWACNLLTMVCQYRSIAVPVSSALFNRAFRTGLIALDIPPAVKIIAAESITAINQIVPAEYLEQILDLLVSSLQNVFLFGLGCAIAAAVTAFAVPWKSVSMTGSSNEIEGGLPFSRKGSHKIDGTKPPALGSFPHWRDREAL